MDRSKQLMRYVVPSVLSMASIFLYSIVDGIFVGRGIGTSALGAVNIAYPYIMIFNALLMLTTVGGMTVVAIRLGRGEEKGASEIFSQALTAGGVFCILAALPGLLCPLPVVRLLGAGETFENMSAEYLFWLCVFLVPCGLNTMLAGFARNDGAPALVGTSTILASVLNMFGDWLFVYLLHMGLKGAAIATDLAQTISFFIVLTHFLRRRGVLRYRLCLPDLSRIRLILLRGLPECVSQFCAPLVIILTNIVLARILGDKAVNAFSVLSYAATFSVAFFEGTAQGLQPLFGNCYGAGQWDDLKYFLKSGIIISVTGSLTISIILYFLWGDICTLFAVEPASRITCMYAMPRYTWCFTVEAVNVIISAYLYSTTRTREALIINVLRSFILNVAVILLLPVIFGPDAIWYTSGVYELMVMFVTIALLRRAEKQGFAGSSAE